MLPWIHPASPLVGRARRPGAPAEAPVSPSTSAIGSRNNSETPTGWTRPVRDPRPSAAPTVWHRASIVPPYPRAHVSDRTSPFSPPLSLDPQSPRRSTTPSSSLSSPPLTARTSPSSSRRASPSSPPSPPAAAVAAAAAAAAATAAAAAAVPLLSPSPSPRRRRRRPWTSTCSINHGASPLSTGQSSRLTGWLIDRRSHAFFLRGAVRPRRTRYVRVCCNEHPVVSHKPRSSSLRASVKGSGGSRREGCSGNISRNR